MHALLGRLRADQRGITLVELIVAMAITSLLLALVGSFFVSITSAQRTVAAVSASTRQGSTSMTQISRYLRDATRLQKTKTTTAPAFVTATRSSAQFYSAIDMSTSNAGVALVTIAIVSGRLQLQTQQGTCPVGGYCSFTATPRTIVLADAVRGAATTDTALFTYLDADDDPVTNPTTSTAYDSIRAVTVNVRVGSTSGTSPNDTTFNATINLRNLDYGAASSS